MDVIPYDEQEVDDDKEEVKQDETAGSLVPKFTIWMSAIQVELRGE